MDIQQSLHRILEQKDTLADLFYLVFLERCPEVRHRFEGVDMRGQVALLTMALMVIERHYQGSYPATAMYLRYLGTTHHDRGIARGDFPKFRAAMLATLERFHSKDWNPHLARQWAEAIDKATTTMLDGYQHHCTV
jgi:hemoglobin-like flavoprotein